MPAARDPASLPALRCAAPGVLLAALVLLPFLGKAFTIDDPLFLMQAQQLLRDPLHPTAFEVVWGDVPQRLSSIMPSGPSMAYLLAPAVRLDAQEWGVHLIQLIVLVGGVLATTSLALRLSLGRTRATLAGLLLASTPAVLAMAGTAMPDVLAMSLGALAMDQFVAWQEERLLWHGILSAVAFALAVLARSHLLLLLGVGALLSLQPEDLWRRRPFALKPHRLAPLCAGLLLAWCVQRLTRDPQTDAVGIFGAAQSFVTWRHLDRHLVALFGHWALSLPLAIPWLLLRRREVRTWPFWPAAALLLILTWSTGWRRMPWIALPAALGVLCFIDLFVDAWTRRDRIQLCLFAWLFLPLAVLFYVQVAPKYHVAAAPAMAILLCRHLPSRNCLRGGLSALFGGTILAGTTLSVLILLADARMAGLGKQAAATMIAPAVSAGHTVWFAGHWGFQFYALKAGGRPLTRTPPFPRSGDLIVGSSLPGGDLDARYTHGPLLRVLSDSTPGGRIMSKGDGADFYSNFSGWEGWEGYLPWVWGRGEIARFTLWQMQ